MILLNFILMFLLSFTFPFLSRYIVKLYPCTLPMLLNTSFKNKKYKNLKIKYKKLKNKLFFYSFNFALISSLINTLIIYLLHTIILSNVLVLNIHDNYMIYLTFNVLYLLFLFMFEIDKNGYIIPDFLTFPFVLFSILFLSFLLKIIPDGNLIFNIFSSSILISALGGIYGYAIGVLISSITYKKYPEGFGGGDIKLLSSLGVLFGINNLYKVILISIISFVVLSYAFKQRYLPYASVLFLSFVIFVISNLLILK